MATYLIVNLLVLVVVIWLLYALRALVWNRVVLATLAVLLVTTAVFDSLIIIAGIVSYNHDYLLGVKVGAAPIEDFFYALVASFLIPSLWLYFKKRGRK